MELAILFAAALLLSACGFIMYVYFFSVGYGLSVAGIAVALLILFRGKLTGAGIALCALLIAYGLRLGGYLLIRELRSASYRSLLKGEVKSGAPFGVKCAIWISCAILYVCQCSPVLFRLRSGRGFDWASGIGFAMMLCGAALEALADLQKSRAKRRDPRRFVSTGLYRLVRCPNYFGELMLWWGVFISGLNVYRGALQWILALVGLLGITYVMFSGARRLELRQDRNYGGDPAYQKYVRATPILIPLVPLYSVKKHSWLVA